MIIALLIVNINVRTSLELYDIEFYFKHILINLIPLQKERFEKLETLFRVDRGIYHE